MRKNYKLSVILLSVALLTSSGLAYATIPDYLTAAILAVQSTVAGTKAADDALANFNIVLQKALAAASTPEEKAEITTAALAAIPKEPTAAGAVELVPVTPPPLPPVPVSVS